MSKGRGEAKLSAGQELLFLTLQSAGEGGLKAGVQPLSLEQYKRDVRVWTEEKS